MLKQLAGAAALATGLIAASSAAAALNKFKVNATFGDGSTATGSFIFDTDSANFLNTVVNYSGGLTFPATTFSVGDELFDGSSELGILEAGTDPSQGLHGKLILFVQTAFPQTFADPDAELGSVSIGTCSNDDFCVGLDGTITASEATLSGEVLTPIPLPAGLPLLVGGLAGLAALRRRVSS